MNVSKRFRWEAAHRLPWHEGDCRHLHGHSYTMFVQLEGPPDERGMVMDFKELKRVVKPLIDGWDHATLVAEEDADLLGAVSRLDSKHFVLPYDSTCENLCRFAADYVRSEGADVLRRHGITTITVRVQETTTSFAETVVDSGT
ncbi:MAG: 6-carboxytetrahydropterin synthase [Rhodothermales bacterium]